MKYLLPLLLLASCERGSDSVAVIGICDLYSKAENSLYVLPYEVGTSWPVLQTNCGPITHFGPQRFAYDFDMPVGTPLVAARDGVVTKVKESTADGGFDPCDTANTVHVQHSDGTVAEYLHLTKDGALVEEGEQVSQGQEIALSGNTGCTTGNPHLHFVVWRDNWHRYGRGSESVPITFSNASPAIDWHLQTNSEYVALP